MTLALHYALRSDVGLLREGNEDSAYAGPRLLAIADGMGGHAAGEVASAVAISAIAPLDRQNLASSEDMLDALAAAVASARNTLHDMSASDPAVEGMGTTLTALLWAGAQVAVCHIGDSRAYLLRDGDLYQITRDHTLIQSLVDEGRLSPAAAANHPQRSLIMRALQGSTDADPDLAMHEALLGDRYLLCSDGLTDVVEDESVHDVLSTIPDPDQAVNQLIALAIHNGGPDNITCIVADVVDSAAGTVTPSKDTIMAGAAANGDVESLLRAATAGSAVPTGPSLTAGRLCQPERPRPAAASARSGRWRPGLRGGSPALARGHDRPGHPGAARAGRTLRGLPGDARQLLPGLGRQPGQHLPRDKPEDRLDQPVPRVPQDRRAHEPRAWRPEHAHHPDVAAQDAGHSDVYQAQLHLHPGPEGAGCVDRCVRQAAARAEDDQGQED